MRRIVSVWTVLLSLTDNLVTHYRKLFNREASSGHVTSNRCHYREHMDCGRVDPLWTSSRSLDVRLNVKWSPRWVLSSSTSFWLRIQAGVQLHAMRNDCLPPRVILSPPPTPHLPSSFVTSSLRRDAVQNQSSSPPTLEKVNTASSIPRQLLFIEQINI